MIRVRFTFSLMLELLVIMIIPYVIFAGYGITNTAIAQSLTESPEGIDTAGNQTTDLGSLTVTNDTVTTAMGNPIPYNNPSFGFTLEFPSNWQKGESLTLVSPQGGIDNQSPEVISIDSEVLPSSDLSLDTYSEASLSQVKSFQDFKLLNSSSTTLAGLPAHMIVYSFVDESETPLQNLQVWTVKDGTAYIITYTGTPEEFESSLPALQGVMDSFRLE
jgi:hypothetical protein